MNSFFNRKNVHPAIWTILISVIGFLGGNIWNNYFKKPEKVFVTNNLSRKDTVVNIVRIIGDTSTLSKNEKMQRKRNDYYEKNLKVLSSHYDKILDSLPSTKKPRLINQNKFVTASILIPKFKMPKKVTGYTEGKLSTFAKSTCPNQHFKKEDIVTIKLEFLDKKWIDKITPLFVDVVRKKSKNSVYQLWAAQYKLTNQFMEIPFIADFPKGEYDLTYGFYILNEVDKKYPTFYSKTCKLVIE